MHRVNAKCDNYMTKKYLAYTYPVENNKPNFKPILKLDLLPEGNRVSRTNPNRPPVHYGFFCG